MRLWEIGFKPGPSATITKMTIPAYSLVDAQKIIKQLFPNAVFYGPYKDLGKA